MAGFNVQLAVVMSIGTALAASLGVLGPLVVESLEISRTQFGWLVSAMTGVNALSSFMTGRLSDRIGGRRLAVVTCLWAGLSIAAAGLAPVYAMMLVATAAAGLAMSASNPATNQLIADHLSAGRRGLTMGVKQSGVQMSNLLAGVALPSIALAIGWRGGLALVAAIAGLSGVTLAITLPRRVDTTDRSRSRSVVDQPLPGDVIWVSSYAVAMGIGTGALPAFLPLYAREAVGLSPAAAGATLGVMGFVGVVARILLPRVVEGLDRFDLALGVLGVGAAASVATLLLAVAWPPLLWVGAMLAGATAMSWTSVANLAAVTLTEGRPAGRASGRINAGFMTGYTIGPVAFGAIVDAVGYTAAWIAPMVGFVAAGVLMRVWGGRARAQAS